MKRDDPRVRDEWHKHVLIEYLLASAEEGDWHAVSDAANDLRVLEAQMAERAKR